MTLHTASALNLGQKVTRNQVSSLAETRPSFWLLPGTWNLIRRWDREHFQKGRITRGQGKGGQAARGRTSGLRDWSGSGERPGRKMPQEPELTSFSSVQFSCSVVSDSLQPHGLQHARPPCPSPTPGVYSNSCPSNR